MKFIIEFELEDAVIGSANLPEEIIKEAVLNYLEGLLSWDASNSESPNAEIYIDTSDDGDDSRYNLYYLKLVK